MLLMLWSTEGWTSSAVRVRFGDDERQVVHTLQHCRRPGETTACSGRTSHLHTHAHEKQGRGQKKIEQVAGLAPCVQYKRAHRSSGRREDMPGPDASPLRHVLRGAARVSPPPGCPQSSCSLQPRRRVRPGGPMPSGALTTSRESLERLSLLVVHPSLHDAAGVYELLTHGPGDHR